MADQLLDSPGGGAQCAYLLQVACHPAAWLSFDVAWSVLWAILMLDQGQLLVSYMDPAHPTLIPWRSLALWN